MPSKSTFSVAPISAFVDKYLKYSRESIDLFAKDITWATHTNDINPITKAEHHMDALDFLNMLNARGVREDLAIFDPPYSPEQLKRSYDNMGLKMTGTCALRTANWSKERDVLSQCIEVGGRCLSFGWDSNGMGRKRGFILEEILLVCHGGGHNDTICLSEKKVSEQVLLWPPSKQGPQQTQYSMLSTNPSSNCSGASENAL